MQYEKAVVQKQFDKLLYNGNRIRPEMFADYVPAWEENPVRVYDADGHFIGIYEFQAGQNDYKPLKVFMEL